MMTNNAEGGNNSGGNRRFRREATPAPVRGRGRGLATLELDYKKPETLKPYLDDFGRIRPRRQTRLDASAQRRLAREVKRARHIAFLPFIDK